jgi:hypothetical protein
MDRMGTIFKTPLRLGPAQARAVLAASVLLFVPLAARAEAQRAAVFPFELDDTSLQGETGGPGANESKRLALIDGELHDLLAKSGRYEPVPLGAEAAKKAADMSLRTCDGCEVPLARNLGAAVSVVGWVQKVSPLILNINLAIRDVKSGNVLQEGSVDIRGDTDESWTRGVRYLLRDRLHILGATGGQGSGQGTSQ